MLVARATSEIARWIASDAILGIPYSAEELDDEGTVVAEPVAEVKPARRTAQRAARPAPQPAPEPELDEPAPDVELITQPQQRKLHALLNERGLGDRERGLAAISFHLDRDLASTKDLTKDEASRVIEALERTAGQAEPVETDDEPAFDEDWPATAPIPGGGE
jgi:hypothetical protein